MLNLYTKSSIIITLILTGFVTTAFSQTLTSPANNSTGVSPTPQLQWTGTSGSSTVEIFDCNAQLNSINLGDYQLAQGPITISAIPDDLSGITYNALTNTLFMITNKSESIYETDLNGSVLRTITLQAGVSNSLFHDTEDIVHISGNTFAVVEERKGRIAIIDIFTNTTSINYNSADLIQMPGTWNINDNTGLEGITFDPATEQLYVVEERTNKELSVFNMPTSFPITLPSASHLCDLQANPFVFTDVSAVHHLGHTSGFSNMSIKDNILLLSDESRTLVETDGNCNIISSLSLPVAKMEGVTMDNNGTLYLVAEPNQLYIYTNPNSPTIPTIHSATVSGNSYTIPNNTLQDGTDYCWQVSNNGNTSTTFSFQTGGPTTICMPISAGTDDIEEWFDGSMYINSTDLELIHDANPARLDQKIGLRFNDMNVPQASQIMDASLQFTTDEATSGTVNLIIRGEDADDASAFTTANGNLSARPTTSASVVWSPANWSIIGERSTKQKTPDLKNIIQEIVDRGNYNSNSSMVLVISGAGTTKRVAMAYEEDNAQVAELCITYQPVVNTSTCIEPNLHIWMEGADDPTALAMRTGLKDNHILPGQNIGTGNPNPSGQPYYQAPWNYLGTEGQGWVDADYPADVVDWVLVSFRTDITTNTEVVKTAALLLTDGTIHFPESCVIPNSLENISLYVVVDHRNHLVAMSDIAVPMTLAPVQPSPNTLYHVTYDFRQQNSFRTSTSSGQKQLPSGIWAMFAGDMDGNYDINGGDKTIWGAENGIFGQYKAGDLNLNGDVNGSDKAPWEVNSGTSSGVPQ